MRAVEVRLITRGLDQPGRIWRNTGKADWQGPYGKVVGFHKLAGTGSAKAVYGLKDGQVHLWEHARSRWWKLPQDRAYKDFSFAGKQVWGLDQRGRIWRYTGKAKWQGPYGKVVGTDSPRVAPAIASIPSLLTPPKRMHAGLTPLL